MLEVLTNFDQMDPMGVPVNVDNIISDQLLSYVSNLNENLGKAGDEYYAEFERFKNDIQSREYHVLTPQDMAVNEFKEYSFGDEVLKVLSYGAVNFFKALANSAITMADRNNPDKIHTNSAGAQYIRGKTYTINNTKRIEK